MLIETLLSFIAGILTVLAPCILPLLPLILGGSVVAKDKDPRRPYIIVASLVLSLLLFTLLLKVSTVLLGIDPKVWSVISGGIIILLGIFMLFPNAWARVIASTGFEHRSQKLLGNAYTHKSKTMSAILTGAALGPVFSSCSPTYAWVIAIVIPQNTLLGMWYLFVYLVGLAAVLLAIALLGRKFIKHIAWASDPNGVFQKGIAVVFIIVGLFVATGWDKNLQTWLVEKDYLQLIQIEQQLVPQDF